MRPGDHAYTIRGDFPIGQIMEDRPDSLDPELKFVEAFEKVWSSAVDGDTSKKKGGVSYSRVESKLNGRLDKTDRVVQSLSDQIQELRDIPPPQQNFDRVEALEETVGKMRAQLAEAASSVAAAVEAVADTEAALASAVTKLAGRADELEDRIANPKDAALRRRDAAEQLRRMGEVAPSGRAIADRVESIQSLLLDVLGDG